MWSKHDITYCSNVHPTDSVSELFALLNTYYGNIRQQRNLDQMQAGLWISNEISELILDSDVLREELQNVLRTNALHWTTANAFPYGRFHGESIKAAVYEPSWSDSTRLGFTQNIAKLMTTVAAPETNSMTISTVPLGYAANWDDAQQKQAMQHLLELVLFLSELEHQTNIHVQVCLEMEPDCVLQSTCELIEFFEELTTYCLAQDVSQHNLLRYLGVCYDICHQAVQFEDVANSVQAICAAGINIGKVQVSSALQITAEDKSNCQPWLQECLASPYLHQTRARAGAEISSFPDLAPAMQQPDIQDLPWRTHFHLPIHADRFSVPDIGSTQHEIIRTIKALHQHNCHPILEIETYTWSVMPDDLRPHDTDSLRTCITAEIAWLEDLLINHELVAEL